MNRTFGSLRWSCETPGWLWSIEDERGRFELIWVPVQAADKNIGSG